MYYEENLDFSEFLMNSIGLSSHWTLLSKWNLNWYVHQFCKLQGLLEAIAEQKFRIMPSWWFEEDSNIHICHFIVSYKHKGRSEDWLLVIWSLKLIQTNNICWRCVYSGKSLWNTLFNCLVIDCSTYWNNHFASYEICIHIILNMHWLDVGNIFSDSEKWLSHEIITETLFSN